MGELSLRCCLSSCKSIKSFKGMGEQLKFVDKKLEHVDSDEEHHGLTTTGDLPVGFHKQSMEDVHDKFAGLIFMCNRQTMQECFHHGLFGLPYNMWHLVSQVTPGTILFLFEYEERKLRGIYEASSDGKLNIEQSPYSKGTYPSQVRFKEVERCPPLDEDEFRDAIQDNYFSDFKFHFHLSYDQVFRLCKAFLWKSAILNKSKVHDSKSLNIEEYVPVDLPLSSCQCKQCTDAPVDCSLSTHEGQQSGCLQSYASPRHIEALKYPYSDTGFSDRWLQNGAHAIINNFKNEIYNNNKSQSKRTADRQVVHRELDYSKYERSGFSIDKIKLSPESKRPQMSQSSLADVMQEETTDIARRICRDGSEMVVYAEKSSRLHADRLNYKPSVWSRISARVVTEDTWLDTHHYKYTDNDDSTNEALEYTLVGMPDLSTVVPAKVREAEDLQWHEDDDVGDLRSTDGTVGVRLLEVDYPISFKRRKCPVEVEREQEPNTLHRKRRKITRPDFSNIDELKKEWEKEFGLLLCMKPDIGEQIEFLKLEEVEGNQCAGASTRKLTAKELEDAFQNNSSKQGSLFSPPSEILQGLLSKSRSVCKSQVSQLGMHCESDEVFDAGGPMAETNDSSGLVSIQSEAYPVECANQVQGHELQETPVVDAFRKLSADISERNEVPENEKREIDLIGLISSRPTTTIPQSKILDVTRARSKDCFDNLTVDLVEIDLNQPLCQSNELSGN